MSGTDGRTPEHGVEEEFCLNSRRWMFKRGFQIFRDCPGNPFGSESSCPEHCSYLEIRKMPAKVREVFEMLMGKRAT